MRLIAVTCMHNCSEQRSSISDGYIGALERAALTPVVIPPSLSPQASVRGLERMDGLLLSGGNDVAPLRYGQQPRPEIGALDVLRDEQEFALVKKAFDLGIPVFGICRGAQVLNVALGGTLIQHIHANGPEGIQHCQNGQSWQCHHHIEVKPGTMLASALGAGIVAVNSHHHQAVDKIAPGLTVSATAPDGLIEGIECADPWILGVQWHPEMMWQHHPEFLHLFEIFSRACKGERP